MSEIDRAVDFHKRPQRTFMEAATKHLLEVQEKPSAELDAIMLKSLMPFIGDVQLDKLHDGTMQKYIQHRKQKDGVKNRTVNVAIELVIRILSKCARKWRDDFGLTWLETVPFISKLDEQADARQPYPMSWKEQSFLMSELPEHLQVMAMFKVNCGCREQEVCQLQWEWEVYVPELNTSVFVIPANFGGRNGKGGVKNQEMRLIVLNETAKFVVNSQRGKHHVYVFPYADRCLNRMNDHAWRKAAKRAALAYEESMGKKADDGFAHMRVHDLKHTFGHRLRIAGVPFEDRQFLLGHKTKSVTTHYSAPELAHLIEMSNRVKESDNRQLNALTIIRQRTA
jgi:integrase